MRLAHLFRYSRNSRPPPVVVQHPYFSIVPPDLIPAVEEWRDARSAYKTEVERGPATCNEERRARLDLSGRWSKAEHELSKVANKLGRGTP